LPQPPPLPPPPPPSSDLLRPIDNPNYAIIDLEFDSVNEAEGLLAAMREVWGRVQGTIMENPHLTHGRKQTFRLVDAIEFEIDDRSEEHTYELQSPYDLVC